MDLALHCHGELKLTNGRNERERDIKRNKELFPQALTHLQKMQAHQRSTLASSAQCLKL